MSKVRRWFAFRRMTPREWNPWVSHLNVARNRCRNIANQRKRSPLDLLEHSEVIDAS